MPRHLPHQSRAGRCLASVLILAGSLVVFAPVSVPAVTCSGGWARVRPPSAGTGPNTLQGVAVTSARNAWAVSYYLGSSQWTSRILHWNGSTWRAQSTPVPAGTDLYSVAAASAYSAWAVGDYYNAGSGQYQTVIVHWNGHRWSRQSSPSPAGTSEFLRGVTAVSAGRAWAVGTYFPSPTATASRTLILHWNGTSWTRQASPNTGTGTNALSAVAATSASSVWAVGQHDGSTAHTLVLHWNGASWSRQKTPTPLGYEALHAVAATSRSNAWAVGDDYAGRTLVLHWNGRSWSRRTSPNAFQPDSLNGVVATSATNMWAVGYYTGRTGAQHRPLFIHWHAGAWHMPSPRSGSGDSTLYGVAAAGAASMWAVGQVGKLNLALRHC